MCKQVLQFQSDIQLLLQVCLVGKSRSYELSDEEEYEQRRARYIRSRQTSSAVTGQRSDVKADREEEGDDAAGSTRGARFQPRDRVETVRNCAALPRDFVDGIVLQVAEVLLGMTADESCSSWNKGGKQQQHNKYTNKQNRI